jgi:hypothetical protein
MGGPRDMIGRVGRNAFPATLDTAPPIKAINSHRFTTTLNESYLCHGKGVKVMTVVGHERQNSH